MQRAREYLYVLDQAARCFAAGPFEERLQIILFLARALVFEHYLIHAGDFVEFGEEFAFRARFPLLADFCDVQVEEVQLQEIYLQTDELGRQALVCGCWCRMKECRGWRFARLSWCEMLLQCAECRSCG